MATMATLSRASHPSSARAQFVSARASVSRGVNRAALCARPAPKLHASALRRRQPIRAAGDPELSSGADLSEKDRDMVQKMVDETMKRMAEDPEHSERMQKILQETQAEMDKDPVAFKAQLKAAKDMRMVQLQALLGQVAMLDPADPDVGYVVKDLRENGEASFGKYLEDEKLQMLLQTKCMMKAMGDQILKIDPEDPEMGQLRKDWDADNEKTAQATMADQRLMQMLTKRAIMDDPYALHGATRVGDTDTMRLLLDMGRDVDAPGPAQLNEASPLHIAAATGMLEPAKVLLEYKAEVNLASPKTAGNSPLHFAVGYGHPEVVTVLLKGGANKNQTNANGQMPEQMAELLQDKTAEEAVLRALNE